MTYHYMSIIMNITICHSAVSSHPQSQLFGNYSSGISLLYKCYLWSSFQKLTYFKVRVSEIEGKMKKEAFHLLPAPQMAAICRFVVGQNQEPGTKNTTPLWVTRSQTPGLSSSAFLGTLTGSWIRSRVAGI